MMREKHTEERAGIPAGPPIHVGMIDNDSLTLRALVGLIRVLDPAILPAWLAFSGAEGLAQAEDHPADVYLIDMSLGQPDGDEVIERIRARDGTTPILAMTSFPADVYQDQAALAGAQGLALKKEPTLIPHLIRQVAGGWVEPDEKFLDPAAARRRVSDKILLTGETPGSRGAASLSDREREALSLSAQGLTSAEIATKMGTSVATINTYFHRAMNRMGARNRMQLLALWLRAGGTLGGRQ
jgi:DNA-binding NarL/FixJ family response regulator